MGYINQKLKSRAGASLLFALLVILLCSMAGSVLITAATASAGRLNGLKEDKTEYYAAFSTVRVLRDQLEGLTVDGDGPDQPDAEQDTLQGLLAGLVSQVRSTGEPAQQRWGLSHGGDLTDRVRQSLGWVEFSMDVGYRLTVQVCCGSSAYTLRLPVMEQEDGTLQWLEGEITKE